LLGKRVYLPKVNFKTKALDLDIIPAMVACSNVI